MGRLRVALAAGMAAAVVALGAQSAPAETAGADRQAAGGQTLPRDIGVRTEPRPREERDTDPEKPSRSGGDRGSRDRDRASGDRDRSSADRNRRPSGPDAGNASGKTGGDRGHAEPSPPEGGFAPAPAVPPAPDLPQTGLGLDLSPVPSVVCTDEPGAPRDLLPIYQAASEKYGLGDKGPGILASINLIETRFGELNEVTSSAGAIGWMQFMPGTWDAYGVDADGDGEADPYNPRDAIFSAANYLSASGAPTDWYGAIFAYNRADWYVADVLAKAGCYGTVTGGAFSLVPMLPELTCEPARPRHKRVPANYLRAFEAAAGRYELGKRGVWALAGIARLESSFGRNMTRRDVRTRGPLGIDPRSWERYGVDGSGDGKVQRWNPADSAATLARMFWSYGDLREGVFNHNQASWYVEAVMAEAEQLTGRCAVTRVDWPIALPQESGNDAINWDNLELTRDSQRLDIEGGMLDPRVMQLLATITQNHRILITSIQTDHSMMTASGNVSNHYHGRAIDIAAVDGVSCTDTSLDSPCSALGRAMTLLPLDRRPTELIYCHDLDGPGGPAFAMADHCGHIHAGFHG